MRKATEDDLQTLQYFWERHEDIERYAAFEDIKQDLSENYPFILAAWSNYKNSKEIFERLLKSIQP